LEKCLQCIPQFLIAQIIRSPPKGGSALHKYGIARFYIFWVIAMGDGRDWPVFFSLFRTRRISRKRFQIVERRCAVLAASVHSCTKVSH
jgi:hypothetical protein